MDFMRILDLPHFARFHNGLVKVLRHKNVRNPLWDFVHTDKFEHYQNGQSWDVFGNAQYVISFIAERHNYAKFVGVWKVLNKRRKAKGGFSYKTVKLPGFEDLTERLIIKWGDGVSSGARSWAQWLYSKGNKEISEILPANYVMEFRGYYDFKLTYGELCRMINHPDSNREWYRMLSSISGIYVILDATSGKQYIGSAYGKGGIWSRWKGYVKNSSGGNILIKELLRRHPDRYKSFQFSILRVLEPETPKDRVLEHESFVKEKLGSRFHGLNKN
jgi:hypothetical protein